MWMLIWMYRVMERKVNRNVRTRDGRKEKSNANLYLYERYDIHFPHPQQFLRQLSVGGTLVRFQRVQ